jgi:hypothetical protein
VVGGNGRHEALGLVAATPRRIRHRLTQTAHPVALVVAALSVPDPGPPAGRGLPACQARAVCAYPDSVLELCGGEAVGHAGASMSRRSISASWVAKASRIAHC